MTARLLFVDIDGGIIAASLRGTTVDWLLAERHDARSRVGDLYLGRVSRMLPGMEAAFVDYGAEVAGFLHRADTPPGTTLQTGDRIVVQVSKDELDEKGARLTMKPGLASRLLVWMPYGTGVAVSARIKESDEVVRLESALPPGEGGVVVRTAAVGVDAGQLQSELAALKQAWAEVCADAVHAAPATVLRAELDFRDRVVRDLARDGEVVVTPAETSAEDRRTVLAAMAHALQRRVSLPSGGSLVIEPTEAMTVVDVNTGAFVGRAGHAATVLQTNLEAAATLARELRLRDVGGVIVVDFIDMQTPADRERVLAALRAAVADDAMRVHVGGISPLGLVEMTRKRTRRSLAQLFATPCSHCDGRGTVESLEH